MKILSRRLPSPSVMTLILLWIYLTVWASHLLISAIRGPGRWEFEDYAIIGSYFIAAISTPAYLAHRRQRGTPPKFRDWLPCVVRIAYISIILALCDTWKATHSHETL